MAKKSSQVEVIEELKIFEVRAYNTDAYRISYEIIDFDGSLDEGASLGEFKPGEESVLATMSIAAMAVTDTDDFTIINGQYHWYTKKSAQKALKAAKETEKRHIANVVWPEWAITAQAHGWKPPKGWKP